MSTRVQLRSSSSSELHWGRVLIGAVHVPDVTGVRVPVTRGSGPQGHSGVGVSPAGVGRLLCTA
jgi:hypothetical protein